MEFDQHYQKHFAAHVLRDGHFLSRVHRDLQPEFFADENLRRLMRLCLSHYEQFKNAPNVMIFQVLDSWKSRQLISEAHHTICSTLADDLFSVQLQNSAYLLEEFDRFVSTQRFTAAAPDITEAFRRGDVKHAEQLCKAAFSYRPSWTATLGREYTADPADRVRRREMEDTTRFWTLIPEIDQHMDGMLHSEIGIWMSQRTSGGKSAALALMARSGLMQSRNVLLFTLEMTEEQYEDRIDQTIAGVPRSGLKDATSLQKSLNRVMRQGGRLRIVSLPPYKTTITHLREHCEMLRQIHGFHADILLIDYIGLVGPHHDSLRGDLYGTAQDVGSSLLQWVKEEKLICWTAAQSGRATTEKDHAVPEDIAGGVPISQIAQYIVTINQSPAEQMENKYRLFLGKNRDGKARVMETVSCDLSRMQFWKFTDPDPNP